MYFTPIRKTGLEMMTGHQTVPNLDADWRFDSSNFALTSHLSECVTLCFIAFHYVSLQLARIYLDCKLDQQPCTN